MACATGVTGSASATDVTGVTVVTAALVAMLLLTSERLATGFARCVREGIQGPLCQWASLVAREYLVSSIEVVTSSSLTVETERLL